MIVIKAGIEIRVKRPKKIFQKRCSISKKIPLEPLWSRSRPWSHWLFHFNMISYKFIISYKVFWLIYILERQISQIQTWEAQRKIFEISYLQYYKGAADSGSTTAISKYNFILFCKDCQYNILRKCALIFWCFFPVLAGFSIK